MPKRSCAWPKPARAAALAVLLAGCATPQYAVRPTPQPEETASALQIEQAISQVQGREFDEEGARPIGPEERLGGFAVQALVDRLSRVTERPGLRYRAHLYPDEEPNAAALADGRVYLSTGMLHYLQSRGSRVDEFAFIVGHELAHTVAQHLVKRYRYVQQQQLLMAAVSVGAAALTRAAAAGAQQAGRWAVDLAGLLQDVARSGYSQEQELEADQLGIRYVARAWFEPRAALALLEDFERFDAAGPFLRTHPYIHERRAQLARYLAETGAGKTAQPAGASQAAASRLTHLRRVQAQYPRGSVSWRNLEREIQAPAQ